jgi:membrane-associated phospholipid phosphatase
VSQPAQASGRSRRARARSTIRSPGVAAGVFVFLSILLGAAGASAADPPAATRAEASAPPLRPSKSEPEPLPSPSTLPRIDPSLPPLVWRDEWPRFRDWEYVVTGVAALASFASLAVPPPATKWRNLNTFDEKARSALRFPDQDDRDVAKDASDLLMTLLINQLFLDTLVVTWWWRGQGTIAWQINMINLEAVALNGAFHGLTSVLAGRERPYFGVCTGPEDDQLRDCRGSKRYRSFFSGHTSTSFVAAGLICSHHIALPLYGGGAAEAGIMCGAGFASAATVGLMRIMSDQHYMSDVLSGAAVGMLFGLGVPWIFHYGGGARPDRPAGGPPAVSIQLVPTLGGGYVTGQF